MAVSGISLQAHIIYLLREFPTFLYGTWQEVSVLDHRRWRKDCRLAAEGTSVVGYPHEFTNTVLVKDARCFHGSSGHVVRILRSSGSISFQKLNLTLIVRSLEQCFVALLF